MLNYGEKQLDPATLPAVTQLRLMQTGLNHVMGNEVASQVGGKIKAAIVAGTDRKADSVKTEEIGEWRSAHQDQVNEWTEQYRAAKLQAMLDGTLTVRAAGSGGVARDPVEAACRAIAKLEVSTVLANNGAKFPGKDTTVAIGGQHLSGDDLIARRLGHAEHGPRIRKEAEAKVRADRRVRENAARAASGEAGLAESLGL